MTFQIHSACLLALGYVLRKKENIKEEERWNTNYTRITQTEEGSKWLNKQKRRSKVKEKLAIRREDLGIQSSKEEGSWTTKKVEEDINGCC
jgi:hypothetical protein